MILTSEKVKFVFERNWKRQWNPEITVCVLFAGSYTSVNMGDFVAC